MSSIKVITLYQPWATLLAHGFKQYETRPSPTNHTAQRGDGHYLIHAGKTFNEECRYYAVLPEIARLLAQVGIHRPEDLPRGVLIGEFFVKCCMSSSNSTFMSCLSRQERMLGNYQPGRSIWVGQGHRPLSNPQPYRGGQGYYQAFQGDYSSLKFNPHATHH